MRAFGTLDVSVHCLDDDDDDGNGDGDGDGKYDCDDDHFPEK